MTDLHKVKDHPANLVASSMEAYTLLLHEQEHDVTFAALDNDTLDAIRAVYDREPSRPGGTLVSHTDTIRSELERLYELEALVSDLLGLED